MNRSRFLFVVMAVLTAASLPCAANTIYVTTTQQGITDPNNCSLQEAIYSANFDQNIAVDSTNPDHFYITGCVAGSGADTITLPDGAVFQMSNIVDDAHNPLGPTATPFIFSEITIEANGAMLQRTGNLKFRAFAVGRACVDLATGTSCDAFNPPATGASGLGDLTIRNAYIRDFAVKG